MKAYKNKRLRKEESGITKYKETNIHLEKVNIIWKKVRRSETKIK